MRTGGLSIEDSGRGAGWRWLSRLRGIGAPAGLVRRWCRSWSVVGVGLVLLCLTVYVPGVWRNPPVDRDEARFAQASRQMWESGDFVVPRVQDRARLNKPPLIYWAQCGSIAVFGDREGQWQNGNIWVFRVPSLLAAMVTVLATWRLGVRMFDPRAGALGAVMLAIAPMVVWDAHQARADQLLVACTTVVMWAMYEVWRGATEKSSGVWWPLVFWVAMGLGVMTKGPITPLVAGLAVAALSLARRDWRWVWRLRPIAGMVIAGAIIAPWIIAVGMRVGWGEYVRTVWDETIGRSASGKEGHWGPPGYHLVMLCVLFWPGVLLTGMAIGRGWGKVFSLRERASADGVGGDASSLGARVRSAWLWMRASPAVKGPELFLLCWVIPAWIVFELVMTKLPHYTMPLYPALALLTARATLSTGGAGVPGSMAMRALRERGARIGFVLWVVIGLGWLLASYAAFSFGAPDDSDLPVFGGIALGAAGCVFALAMVWAAVALWKGEGLRALGLAAAAFVPLLAITMGVSVPRANSLSVRVAEWFRVLDASGKRVCAAAGYHEDSLVFLTRGRVERIEWDKVNEWCRGHPQGILAVRYSLPEFTNREIHSGFKASIEGLNYSKGRWEQIHIYSRP